MKFKKTNPRIDEEPDCQKCWESIIPLLSELRRMGEKISFNARLIESYINVRQKKMGDKK